jgi:autotransporter-associated beta strand protein
MPASTLTLATPNSSYNTLSMTVSLGDSVLGMQGEAKTPTITGACSVTLNALFNPTTYQATTPSITFNQQQPGQISLQNATFSGYSWVFGAFKETMNTTSVVLTPCYTGSQAPPTPVSGGLFAGNQMSMMFNGGSFNYSGTWSDTWNFSSSPEDFTNGTTSSGTLAISAPTMNGTVATYTATVTLPLSLNQSFSKTLVGITTYTTQVVATGTLKASGTFQFDFGPRVVNWDASAGDFSAGGNWDVGFAPRTGDTAAIENGSTTTLATAFSGTPAAVWVGNGAATSGTLTLASGGSLSCGAMVLGQSGGSGTLILGGGTLLAPSIVQGTGGSGTLYFNGGTLRATGSNNQFLAGLGAAYIGAGGATIDSNAFAVSISQVLGRDPALGSAPDGGLLKIGTGELTLSGNNSYSGGTTVSGGTLTVANAAGSATGSGPVTVNPGAALAGSGIIGGPLTVAGALGPGHSPEILTVNNQVSFQPGSVFNAQVLGTTPGSGYDQLVTTGPVSLAGSLNLTFGPLTPTGHDVLFLINNTGSGATTGTFQYADNSEIGTFDGFDWFITYEANDAATPSLTGGNDVAIYSVPEPSTLALLAAVAVGLLGWARRRGQSA